MKTFVEALDAHARTRGSERAMTWIADGEREDTHLTFAELHDRASAVAAALGRGCGRGDRVVVLTLAATTFLPAFLGCAMRGAIAVPVYPPNPARLDQTMPRLLGILDNANPTAVLTTSELAPLVEPVARARGMAMISVDALPVTSGVAEARPEPEDVAFLQYTSGSTGEPKGVVVTHGNVVANLEMIRQAYDLNAAARFVSWLPLYHDMGLMAGFLGPLMWGAHTILMPPWRVLERPVRWLQAMTRFRAHASPSPNFGFELAIRKVDEPALASLDLSTWRVALDAAEPVRASTLERFASKFQACGFDRSAFYPTYGLAEATVFVCAAPRRSRPTLLHVDGRALAEGRIVDPTGDEHRRTFVALGSAPVHAAIQIVDPESGRAMPDRAVGEIWVTGPHVAQGYFSDPVRTEQTFGASLHGDSRRWLRTGDLGVIDGELYVVGRRKDVLIIRGKNHASEDLEYTVAQACPQLRPGSIVAFSVDDGEVETVVIVAEPAAAVDIDVVARDCRREVATTHELHVGTLALVPPGTIPKTSSGKVQRAACKAAFERGTLRPIGMSTQPSVAPPDDAARPRSPLRAAILAAPGQGATILGAYLRAELAQLFAVAPEAIEDHRTLVAYGMDSLKAVELKFRVEDDLGIDLALEHLRADLTVAALIDLGLVAIRGGQAVPRAPALPRGAPERSPIVAALDDRTRDEGDVLALVTRRRRWTCAELTRELRAPEHTETRALATVLGALPPSPAGHGDLFAIMPLDAAGWALTASALVAGATVLVVDDERWFADPDLAAFDRPAPQVSVLSFPVWRPGWFAMFEQLARSVDALGFDALWLPERHFHAFGEPFPNPSVLAAAVATWTSRVRIRAGSVVLPLHHPVRIVEEWAVVDQLSRGRVDIAFAAGRNARDFIFDPAAYGRRREALMSGVDVVRALWRGEVFRGRDGLGRDTEVVTAPRPVQPALAAWITTSSRPEAFEGAGHARANVLTALMEQDLATLAANTRRYRAIHPTGTVSLMLHAYLDDSVGAARAVAGPAFKGYLAAFIDLWRGQDEASGLRAPNRRETEAAVELGFERYARSSALFTTEALAMSRIDDATDAGANEIVCIVDFGLDDARVLASVARLARVRDALRKRAARPSGRLIIDRAGRGG